VAAAVQAYNVVTRNIGTPTNPRAPVCPSKP
jgi:hypothetical protein